MYPLSYVINQSCQKASTVGLTPIKEDPSYIDWDRWLLNLQLRYHI